MGFQPRLIDVTAFAQQQDTRAAERDTLKGWSAAYAGASIRFEEME
jgi:hypothetical protein